MLLGAISLDLLAVSRAASPRCFRFTRAIFWPGPWGLGLLRAAPAVGALSMSVFGASRDRSPRLGSDAVHGLHLRVASTVFALSTWVALSFAALFLRRGRRDLVVIRQSLVQTRTPQDMLGRVMSVNRVLRLLGHARRIPRRRARGLDRRLPSALIGGVGVILIALTWFRLLPRCAALNS